MKEIKGLKAWSILGVLVYIALLLVFLAVFSVANADANELAAVDEQGRKLKGSETGDFFGNADREGYWWYEEPLVEEPKEVEEQRPPKVAAVPPVATAPVLAPPSEPAWDKPWPKDAKQFDGFKHIPWDQLQTMHPDDFQDLTDKTLKWAMVEPDQQKSFVWMLINAVASQRSMAFTNAQADALNKNPTLDARVNRHPSEMGSIMQASHSRADRDYAINKMRADMGLLLFTRPDCSYCWKQKKILTAFIEKWQWGHLAEVDITASDKNSDMALEYGVQLTPDIFVVGNVDGTIMRRRLGAGLMELGDIEKGLLDTYSRWFNGERYEGPKMVEKTVTLDDLLKNMENQPQE